MVKVVFNVGVSGKGEFGWVLDEYRVVFIWRWIYKIMFCNKLFVYGVGWRFVVVMVVVVVWFRIIMIEFKFVVFVDRVIVFFLGDFRNLGVICFRWWILVCLCGRKMFVEGKC